MCELSVTERTSRISPDWARKILRRGVPALPLLTQQAGTTKTSIPKTSLFHLHPTPMTSESGRYSSGNVIQISANISNQGASRPSIFHFSAAPRRRSTVSAHCAAAGRSTAQAARQRGELKLETATDQPSVKSSVKSSL